MPALIVPALIEQQTCRCHPSQGPTSGLGLIPPFPLKWDPFKWALLRLLGLLFLWYISFALMAVQSALCFGPYLFSKHRLVTHFMGQWIHLDPNFIGVIQNYGTTMVSCPTIPGPWFTSCWCLWPTSDKEECEGQHRHPLLRQPITLKNRALGMKKNPNNKGWWDL